MLYKMSSTALCLPHPPCPSHGLYGQSSRLCCNARTSEVESPLHRRSKGQRQSNASAFETERRQWLEALGSTCRWSGRQVSSWRSGGRGCGWSWIPGCGALGGQGGHSGGSWRDRGWRPRATGPGPWNWLQTSSEQQCGSYAQSGRRCSACENTRSPAPAVGGIGKEREKKLFVRVWVWMVIQWNNVVEVNTYWEYHRIQFSTLTLFHWLPLKTGEGKAMYMYVVGHWSSIMSWFSCLKNTRALLSRRGSNNTEANANISRSGHHYISPNQNTHSILSSNQVKLISYEQTDVLDILPLFPSSWQHIPVFRSTDQ